MAPPRVLPPSKNRVDIPRITRTGDTLGRQRRGYYRISAQKSMAMDIGVIICTLQNPLINEEMTDLGLGQETSARDDVERDDEVQRVEFLGPGGDWRWAGPLLGLIDGAG